MSPPPLWSDNLRPGFLGVLLPRVRGRGKKKYHRLGVAGRRENTQVGYRGPPAGCSALLKRRHHVTREPAELLLELLGGDALGPVDHELIEAWVLGLDRFDSLDDLRGRAQQPRPLLDAVLERRHARGCARRAPGTAFGVGVADEAERREPLVPLVVGGLDAAERLLRGAREVDAGAPAHILAELFLPAVPSARVAVGPDDLVEELLAVERHHRLEAVLAHEVDGLAARDRHPDLDRPVERARHAGDLAEAIAAVVDVGRDRVVLAPVIKGLLVEALEEDLELLLEQLAIGGGVEERRAEAVDPAG